MTISIIVAVSKNNVIGINGELPWHLSDDLKNFKKLTTGKPIIMGRKTFESIGKPLPNRTNIIISRNQYYNTNCDSIIADSLESAIDKAREFGDEIMIIGGEQIYEQTLNIADMMYMTIVNAEIDGDTFFPEWDESKWKLIDETNFSRNQNNDFDFFVKVFEKI